MGIHSKVRKVYFLTKLLPSLAIRCGGYLAAIKELVFRFYVHGATGLNLYLNELPQFALKNHESTHLKIVDASSLKYLFELKKRILSNKNLDSQKLGYVIWAPNYVSNSAGIGCLYVLADHLNKKGFPTYLVGSTMSSPNHLAPLVSFEDAIKLIKFGFIAVYPETITGNPLNSKKVARWVLNVPGYLGGEKVYAEDELVFYYADGYKEYIKNKIAGKLYLPTINEEIFYNDGTPYENRSLECYYVGKSKFVDGYFDKSKVFEITRDVPPKRELGKLLRSSRVLYCFDCTTIFAYEAIMCGCPVVLIPDGSQKRENYVNGELGIDGIAWGPEEYDMARANIKNLGQRYQGLKSEYQKQLDRFIELTQSLS